MRGIRTPADAIVAVRERRGFAGRSRARGGITSVRLPPGDDHAALGRDRPHSLSRRLQHHPRRVEDLFFDPAVHGQRLADAHRERSAGVRPGSEPRGWKLTRGEGVIGDPRLYVLLVVRRRRCRTSRLQPLSGACGRRNSGSRAEARAWLLRRPMPRGPDQETRTEPRSARRQASRRRCAIALTQPSRPTTCYPSGGALIEHQGGDLCPSASLKHRSRSSRRRCSAAAGTARAAARR